jgi:type I restriction enzyme, S subunit
MNSNWEEYRIEEIAQSMGDAPFGSSLKTEDYREDGILVIQGKNIAGRVCDWSDRKYVSVEKYDSLSRSHCFLGDLIFPKVGTIGKVGILTQYKDHEKYLLSTNTMRLRPNPMVADIDFVYYFFSSPRTINLIHALNSKSVQPVFNFTTLKNFRIPLPPIEEQNAIAAVLSAFDDKIELNRQMNATLEERARALFKSWFVDFDPVRRNQAGQPSQPYDHLFPDKLVVDENGRGVPEGWRVGTLNDCCVRVENGGTPKRNEPSFWTPPEIPWLTSGEVRQSIIIGTENFISTKGLANSSAKIWPIGTTVVAMYGATAGETTMLAQELCTNQACCGLIPNKHMQYFNFLLISQSTESLARQARGSAQQNLSQKLISRFPAIIPNTIVLETFDHLVKPLFDKWVANLYESRTLADLRDTLLPRLMSGQLRIPVKI